MGGAFTKEDEQATPLSKLDAKMVEAMRQRAARGSSMRAFNTIILKFPRIDENLRKCKSIFEEFDEDSNGAIDHNELKSCFEKLEVTFTEEETNDLFEACDINDSDGIQFNEFVVVLSLVYLLHEPTTPSDKSRFGESIKATFETIVDAFVFLDKNKDGFVSKAEMVQAINETNSGERSSGRIAMKRFEEMDWDRNGMVTFKEFVFAFTRWLGMDDLEDED